MDSFRLNFRNYKTLYINYIKNKILILTSFAQMMGLKVLNLHVDFTVSREDRVKIQPKHI